MPKKLTNKELKELKYVSMTDFCIRVKEYNDMNDKLRFATQYLLLHGTQQGEADCSLAEATYIAQLAIVAASKVEKEKMGRVNEAFLDKNPQIVNPHVKNAKDDLPFEYFLRNPKGYLKGYAEKNIEALDNINIKNDREASFRLNLQDIVENKLEVSDFNSDVYDYFVDAHPAAVRLRVEMMLGGKDKLTELYNKTKPSFGASFFRTTSQAAKNLDTVYKAFNNPNHAMYGDRAAMKKAANEYLEHKFPGWKPGDEFPEEDLNRLDGSAKARSELSIALLKNMEAQEMFDDYLKNQVDEAYKVQGITFQDVDRPPLNQDIFHENLENDIKDDEDVMSKSVDDSDISLDNNIDNEIQIKNN